MKYEPIVRYMGTKFYRFLLAPRYDVSTGETLKLMLLLLTLVSDLKIGLQVDKVIGF